MEHESMPGVESLAPPTSDVAQRYLDSIEPTARRREARVDRRGLAWLTLLNAGVVIVFGAGLTLMHRSGTTAWSAIFIGSILIASRLVNGAVDERGVRWRFSRDRVIEQTVTMAAFALAFITVGLELFLGYRLPLFTIVAPSLVGFAMLLAVAAAQFWRERAAVTPRDRAPLTAAARWTTIGLSVLYGLIIPIAGFGTDSSQIIASVLSLLAILGAAIAESAGRAISRTGGQWRWPHFAVFAVAVFSLFSAAILGGWGMLAPPVSIAWGVLAALLLAVTSVLPGRSTRG